MVGRVVVVWMDRRAVVDVCQHERDLRNKTVAELKRKILEKNLIPGFGDGRHIKLIFGAKELDDDSTLSEYGINHKSVVIMSLPLDGGGCSTSMEKLAGF